MFTLYVFSLMKKSEHEGNYISRATQNSSHSPSYLAKSQLMSPRIFMRSGWTEVRLTLAVFLMCMVLFSARFMWLK